MNNSKEKTKPDSPPAMPRLVRVDPRILDVPPTRLERQPTLRGETPEDDVIDMVLLTRPPIISPKNAQGRRLVLANGPTILWYRMLPRLPQRRNRIQCIEVPDGEIARAKWQAVDQWAAVDLMGWNSQRRSQEVRRGLRGTALAGKPLRVDMREALACLLEKAK